MENNLKLKKKLFIHGSITVKTGLHIGGSHSSKEIGGVDNDVVKTGNGVPFIPGSSLKGKMRSLLAKVEGAKDIKQDSTLLKKMFGYASAKDETFLTRILVRDCMLDTTAFTATFGTQGQRNLDFDFSEIKSENDIKRDTGKANPRQMERVPAQSIFNMEVILSLYESDDDKKFVEKIKQAFDLLNMDYLGGSGSRGYGAIEIKVKEISGKEISEEGVHPITNSESLQQIFNIQ